MQETADVERFDMAVGYLLGLRPVRLLAIVDRQKLGDDIASVLIPALLIGMAKFAGLKRELPGLVSPGARPLDALL